ncbi:MAG: ribosome recycling factor [bacterium]|nr:ribosome recycling factor [bacterium]
MNLDEVGPKMTKALEWLKGEVASIRTGRATTSLVENIVIGAYGNTARMKVVELATITVPDSQTITITPYDQSIIGDIRRDIEAANVGLTPVIDNQLIRIGVPSLTSERRMEFVKLLHVKLEEGRVKVRQIRHEKMGELKRAAEAGELNEDERDRLEEELQSLTDNMMAEIDAMGQVKEAELSQV